MNKKHIRKTESDLHNHEKESINNMLNEKHIIKVQYDEGLSHSRGRKYYNCKENGRYYANIDGTWYTCTDNYLLEPDCHLADNVEIVVEL